MVLQGVKMQYIQFNGSNTCEILLYTNGAISINKSSEIPNIFECYNYYDFVCLIKDSDYIYREFGKADWEVTSAENFEGRIKEMSNK